MLLGEEEERRGKERRDAPFDETDGSGKSGGDDEGGQRC